MSGDLRRVTSTGLTMPPDFPVRPYEAILDTLRENRDSAPDAWREFAFGWNALSYRFAAMAEHDQAFSESIRTHGLSPEPPGRYRQEDALFNFFGAGLSALETFGYGTWAIAWAAGNPDLALATEKQQKQVELWHLRDRLALRSPGPSELGRVQRIVERS